MDRAAKQCTFLLRQASRLMTGLDDRHRTLRHGPGAKTAGWLVGHLVITGDFGRRLSGRPPIAPKEWRAAFAPGTQPTEAAAQYPPMAALIETFNAVYADLVESAPAASAELLAVPNPYEPARPAFPTAGDFVRYLLTGHLAYHLGQLSQWRALAEAAEPALRPPNA